MNLALLRQQYGQLFFIIHNGNERSGYCTFFVRASRWEELRGDYGRRALGLTWRRISDRFFMNRLSKQLQESARYPRDAIFQRWGKTIGPLVTCEIEFQRLCRRDVFNSERKDRLPAGKGAIHLILHIGRRVGICR